MLILGVNFSHDSSVAIIKDGEIIAAIEEEKVSRIKQDFGWPKLAIERLFIEHDLKRENVDVVALESGGPYNLGKDEIKYRFTKNKSAKNLEYINRITAYYGIGRRKIGESSMATLEDLIRKEGFVNAKVEYFDHHLSHAASAFYTSPIKCNLIVTSDGHGGDSAFNFYVPGSNGLELIRKNDYSVSIGAFYSMITKLLGFRPTRHEGKITGLAAYGTVTPLVELFQNLFYYEGDALRRFPGDEVQKYWKDYGLDKKLGTVQKINLEQSSSAISRDYGMRSAILLEWLKKETEGYSKEDVAFACQKVAEDVTLMELDKVIKKHFPNGGVVVGLAGGVFANVRINQKIYEAEGVENIFVHPAMGDPGLALGNAVLSDLDHGTKDPISNSYAITNTFFGPDYTNDLLEFVKDFKDPEVNMTKMQEPGKEVATILANNGIVGFWSGSLEWGPRALGRRTIMLNTFDKTVNKTLNDRLNRTEFMPFAPVVLDKMAKTYFPKYDPSVPAADYMTITYDTDPQFHELLQATVHVDGTARPQIAYKNKTPLYYDILNEFHKLTDCGALVNTSFNAHEEPILSTPETGIGALKTNRVDYLVMDDYLFSMKK